MLLLYIAMVVASMLVYMAPGLVLARGMYAQQMRAIRNAPVPSGPEFVIPPEPKKPVRPKITVEEMLHTNSPIRCGLLRTAADMTTSCTCKYRDEWIQLKNAWIDYREDKKNYDYWHRKFGNVNPDTKPSVPTVNMRSIYAAVPLWPFVGAGMYIKGGANNIPDYREIERLEMKELN